MLSSSKMNKINGNSIFDVWIFHKKINSYILDSLSFGTIFTH